MARLPSRRVPMNRSDAQDVPEVEGFDQPEMGEMGEMGEIDVNEKPGDVQKNKDGTTTLTTGDARSGYTRDEGFYKNLVESLTSEQRQTIASEYIDLIEKDKAAHDKRDKQYEESMKRTGLSGMAPGGADFDGASKVAHPGLLEAAIDFCSRVTSEVLPPGGPAKPYVRGKDTKDKIERAQRVARLMNYQLTEKIYHFEDEMENGFTQSPLGGAFYVRMWYDEANKSPDAMFVPIDKVHRPESDGPIYNCDRYTYEEPISQITYDERIKSGTYFVEHDTPAPAQVDDTKSEAAAKKIAGTEERITNEDGVRPIWVSSIVYQLELDDDEGYGDGGAVLPYVAHFDFTSRKLIALYRNWPEGNANKERIDLLIEFPFWPWRGGIPIGMGHMIGMMAGAATGALRALLDAAFQQNSQTGFRLKGAATVGGMNVKAQPGEIREISGSLASDDIRKTLMMSVHNGPSATLFQLLVFLNDKMRGVVRTTFDEMAEMGGSNVPVGTTQALIEQGLSNFRSIHRRTHRAMGRLLRLLYIINSMTVSEETIVDAFGDLEVKPEDFQGPACVIPVSDPRVFSDLQRMTQAQQVAARAATPVGMQLYDQRKVEIMYLERMRVPDPEELLVKPPTPERNNAVNENVASGFGRPIMAFPDQDHVAHLQTHVSFMESPFLGFSPVMAPTILPALLAHMREHILFLYLKDTVDMASKESGNDITEAMDPELEPEIAALLAEVSPKVVAELPDLLNDVGNAMQKAMAMLQQLKPKPPPDPATEVLMMDQKRRAQEGEQKFQIDQKRLTLVEKKDQSRAALDAKRLTDQEAKDKATAAQKMMSASIDSKTEAQDIETNAQVKEDEIAARERMNDADNETALEIARMSGKKDMNPGTDPGGGGNG